MNKIEIVTTIGMGYIGLPTAALIANSGIRVHGVDVNPKVVEAVNEGRIIIVEPDLDGLVKRVVEDGYLSAHLQPVEADVYTVAVPTPFKGNHEPDISYVLAAGNAVIPLLKAGDLFIIESTSPVGTTEKVKNLIYSKRPDLEGTIFIAYCPERVLPGNIIYELEHNDRVIGGINEESTERACEFFQKFVTGELHRTNSKTAEMCKLVENSSRDVQIAFANELSIICDKAGIDVWELIELANRHPRVNILTPGCGVGGHCIAVDPYFIVSEYPLESQIIGKAREINNYKAFWCVEKIKNASLQFQLKHGYEPKIALMGMAFKPNIDDLRESPAKYIAQKVIGSEQNGILLVEPNIDSHPEFELSDYKNAFDAADMIVYLVAHSEFYSLPKTKDKLILDFCGVTNKQTEEIEAVPVEIVVKASKHK
ncbi:UDP-N-acetyl-D-mannosamine dehydrogenase [Labilibaculum sp. A4]|uniref:UDP-N-acetyl-D-mannosamine dehydrogenase n=1 Tax=Labilibaculum euxinus TaxID=2686357 RepID=UPI000F61E84E|nr:UDP-N-acetyl-D-mannosamine dehydrogenase [Labilibaculum euxinus]MDQ1769226.1 UDP-N-acetyl-D-mannosamine dehydrogenase [Labilibaculum euxinus]MWN74750.1 UDP-N-acetyl-D-mannosamine dehydrogenase [Labilibaculum euxinus]